MTLILLCVHLDKEKTTPGGARLTPVVHLPDRCSQTLASIKHRLRPKSWVTVFYLETSYNAIRGTNKATLERC